MRIGFWLGRDPLDRWPCHLLYTLRVLLGKFCKYTTYGAGDVESKYGRRGYKDGDVFRARWTGTIDRDTSRWAIDQAVEL